MHLQGSALNEDSRGGQVALLHSELRRLTLVVPLRESSNRWFGPDTRRAVEQFQRGQDIPVTGLVDEVTAAKLGAAVMAIERDPPERSVSGRVMRPDGTPLRG